MPYRRHAGGAMAISAMTVATTIAAQSSRVAIVCLVEVCMLPSLRNRTAEGIGRSTEGPRPAG